MIILISISLDEDYEQFALTLLGEKLMDRGFIPEANLKKWFDADNWQMTNNFYRCTVFIGLMTTGGSLVEKVLAEYNFALSKNKETILLVESGVELPLEVEKRGHVVYFDRDDPQSAIEKIENNIRHMGKEVSLHPDYKGPLAWLLCGQALIATIKFLSSEEIKAERNAALGVLA